MTRRIARTWLAFGAGLVNACTLCAQDGFEPAAGMMRFPDVSATRVCFVYANDIWVAPKGGGQAVPLASPPGMESLPRFSPDGTSIAFVGNYDGNRDIYTIEVDRVGAVPGRVTHHPAAETLCDWTPDGTRLLFFQNGLTPMARIQRLYTVSAGGGLPEALPMPYGGFGAFSPDGKSVVFNLLSTDTRTWKRYRGGMAPDVWVLDLESRRSRRITDWEGTDTQPMWHGDKIYYVSDAGPEHRLNIWSFDPASGTHAQVTRLADDDVRWPSIGPGDAGEGEIVFQYGAHLHLLDLGTGEVSKVLVRMPGARAALKERRVDASKVVRYAGISPGGKRVVFGARGDIWSVPAKEGVTRQLTSTSGVAERDPAWSPDGKLIAYFSDESGEYELYVRASDARPEEKKPKEDEDQAGKDQVGKDQVGKGESDEESAASEAAPQRPETRRLTSFGAGWRFDPTWSPDSKKIALTDHAARLWIVDVASGEAKPVDRDPWGDRPSVAWSGDSAWLAYSRWDDPGHNPCLYLYDVGKGESTRVTSPAFAHTSPTFDRAGDFLFCVATREVGDPLYSDVDDTFAYRESDRVVAFPLRRDVKDPWRVRSDEEELKPEGKGADQDGAKDAKKDGEGGEPKPAGEKEEAEKGEGKKDAAKKPKPVRIELDGFEGRGIITPIKAGSVRALAITKEGKIVFGRASSTRGERGLTISILDPKDAEKEEKTIVEKAQGFELAADGKTLLVWKDGWEIRPAEPGGKAQKVSTGAMLGLIDPKAEWRQMVMDVWRLYRDYFYEPGMHGCDWDGIRDHYLGWLDDCSSREDVNWLLSEMVSELNIGHAYVMAPGDVEDSPSVPVGLLACDFEVGERRGQKAYRISKIYAGAPWDVDALGPLSDASLDVREGDFLLAVNGRGVDPTRDPWAALVGTAGKPTSLTIARGDAPEREILVTPLESEMGPRYRAWIERNRRYVLEKSGGRLAYLHVPDTGVNGQNNLFRQFFGQRRLDGMIVDERWNGGGQIPWRFIELLNRPATNGWARRHAADEVWPPAAHHGPKAMLVNGSSGSGGDCFPAYFRAAGLGKIIGQRTWGGLVGITTMPGLTDGGTVSVPLFAYYDLDGTWGVEGHGVDPDIAVLDDPGLMLDGGDPQLDAAIAHLLEELKTKTFRLAPKPAGPDRKGMGILESDK